MIEISDAVLRKHYNFAHGNNVTIVRKNTLFDSATLFGNENDTDFYD